MNQRPLHWCEVLEAEHAAILAARGEEPPEPGVPSPGAERWDFTTKDIADVDGLADALERERGLWSWLLSRQTASMSRAQRLIHALKRPEAYTEQFWAWAATALGLAPRAWTIPSEDSLVWLLNGLLAKEGLTRVRLASSSSAEHEPLPLEATLAQRNRSFLERHFGAFLHVPARRTSAAIQRMHALGPAALCLSGGGIRSATFGLGVLQGLARKGLLQQFDYLSTVSGGGYIGSWFTSWLHREKDAAKVMHELACGVRNPLQPEAATVAHLRAYSNYLTPKLGIFSVDTWTLVATYLRNLLLTWLVLVPPVLAVLLLPACWNGWRSPLRPSTLSGPWWEQVAS